MTITFEPLPPHGSSQRGGWGIHGAIAKELRARPGEWAHILTFDTVGSATATAYSIRKGARKAWAPAGSFEARSRTVDGEYRVYARYLGGAS
ncbi:hypothetical protein [Streptomyces sp. NPDC096068]|uniref:hypothetical protein n=1 Tax=Streptomyces sp. NPDC096068 TaxID=3155424 RepID=UPI00332CB67D